MDKYQHHKEIFKGFVLEDVPESADWLGAVLLASFPGIKVHYAASIADANKVLQHYQPDIALIDIGLPDGSGVDIVKWLSEQKTGCTSIVATIFAEDKYVFSALRAGAAGYVLKDQSQNQLVTMLQNITDGQPPLSPSIARKLLAFFQPHDDGENHPALTPREQEVLTIIAKGYSIPKTAEMLALSPHTVNSYVKTIYRKLNISSRAEASLEAARRGLIDPLTE